MRYQNNPNMLPKIRSKSITDAAKGQNCALRIASFIGEGCSGNDTVVLCHVETIGKGTSTKVSDLFGAFGCSKCHEIAHSKLGTELAHRYPAAYVQRWLDAMCETQSRLVGMDIIVVPGAEVIQ